MSADSAVQTAVYASLTTFSTLTNLLASGASSIVDHVPQDASASESAFPFVVIGDIEAQAWDADDRIGAETFVTLHAWGRTARGKKPVQTILSALHTRLHRASLTVGGSPAVDCLWDGLSQVMRDPDGLTYHGVIRFRVVTSGGV